MSSAWNFEITSLTGAPLDHEAFPSVMRISKVWNGPRILEATLPLNTKVPALLDLGKQLVIASREEPSGRVVRFHGILWARTFSFRKPNPTATITAVDPWAILARRFTSANFTQEEQMQIIKQLIETENAISTTRINTSVEPEVSKLRDRSWADNPRPLDEALQSLTTVLDPVDIDFRPQDLDDDGNIVTLVTEERDSSPSSVFTLGWGEDTVNNCNSIEDSISMDDVATTVEGFGDAGITTSTSDLTGLASYGLLVRQETWDSVREQVTLDDHAEQMLQKYRTPLPTIQVETRRGADIMLWDHFDVGDVVDVDARLGDVQSFSSARVVESTVEVDRLGERIINISLQEARV